MRPPSSVLAADTCNEPHNINELRRYHCFCYHDDDCYSCHDCLCRRRRYRCHRCRHRCCLFDTAFRWSSLHR